MATELRNTILNSEDIRREVVDVPEWGNVKVEVRGLSGKTRAALLASATADPTGRINYEKWFADLLIATLYDPDSQQPIFQAVDRDSLNQKSGEVINRLAEVASGLSGLGAADVETAKADFSPTQSDDSTSS